MSDRMDSKLREMTIRLIEMSPEAPPFPEEPMVQLRPSPTSQPTPPRRRSPLVLVGAAALAVMLAVGGPLLFDRLAGNDVAGPATPPTASTVPPATEAPPSTAVAQPAVPTNVTLFFVDDLGHLVPMGRVVDAAPSTHDQIAATLEALLAGPKPDDRALVSALGTSLPAGVAVLGLTTDQTVPAGTVEVVLNPVFEAADLGAVGQIVFSVTQFAGIETVTFVDEEGAPLVLGDGTVLDTSLSRLALLEAGAAELVPPVFVDAPAVNGVVGSPLTITGIANVPDGEVFFEVVAEDGTSIADGSGPVSCGGDCWGEFALGGVYESMNVEVGYVVVYATSAGDGSRVNEVRHLVTLEAAPPGEGAAGPYEVIADIPGSPPLDGITVVTSPLAFYGTTAQGTEVRVNGVTVPVSDGSFEVSVDLEPGPNEILIEDVEFNGEYTVTYLPEGSVELVYIDGFLEDGIVVDEAEWLTGDEANQAAFEDGVVASAEEDVPGGFYIRNPDSELTTHAVASEFSIFLATPASGPVAIVRVAPEEWFGLFRPDSTPWDPDAGEMPPEPAAPHFGYLGAGTVDAPYWLTVDSSGFFVQIVQQYVP